MSGRFQPENGADSPTALRHLTIGAAVRVHAREERALIRYKVARANYNNHSKYVGRFDRWARHTHRYFREALVARREWSTLQEIIEAEERRVAA